MFNTLFRGWLFTTAAAVTAALALTFGPPLEGRLFPPLVADFAEVSQTGDTLTFWMVGSRPRDCRAESISAAWIYGDGLVGPATVYRANRTIVGSAPATPLRNGDTFRLGPYTTEIPAQALELRYSTILRCGTPWDLINVETLTLADIE